MSLTLATPLPWTPSQLRRLGTALVGGGSVPADCPSYDAVLTWHHELSSLVASDLVRNWDACPLGSFDVTARAKTVDTLVQKLERQSTELGRIQDIAGVRLDGDLTLDSQEKLTAEIVEHYTPTALAITVRDQMLNQPHSGYRAVHLHVRLPSGRVEIQIRTRGQSAWANAYEALADIVGREIRYGDPPRHGGEQVTEVTARFHAMSEEIATMERAEFAISRIPYTKLAEQLSEFDLTPEKFREAREGIRTRLRELSDTLTRLADTLNR